MRSVANWRASLLSFGGQKTSSFVSAASKVLFSSVCLMALNMGTGILVARFLGPEGRGEQAAMIMWPQFIAFSLTFGIPSSLVYYYKKNKAFASDYFTLSILFAGILGVISALVGVFLIPRMLTEYSQHIVIFAQIAMVFCPIILLSTYMSSALQAYDNYRLLNLSKTTGPFISLLLILLLIFLDKVTPIYTALAYSIGGLPIVGIVFFVLYKQIKITYRNLKQRSKELFGYGIRAYAVDLLGTISMQLDQILVVAMLTPTQMGYYSVALALSKLPKIIQTTIVTVLFPKASGNDEQTVLRMTLVSFRIGVAVTGLFCIAAIFLSSFAIEWLYGHEFLNAVTTVQILLVREIVASGVGIMIQFFMANGKPGFISIMEAIGISLNVPLMLWLLPAYGLPGVAIALLATALVRLAFVSIMLRRRYPGKVQLVLTGSDIRLIMQELRKLMDKLKKRREQSS